MFISILFLLVSPEFETLGVSYANDSRCVEGPRRYQQSFPFHSTAAVLLSLLDRGWWKFSFSVLLASESAFELKFSVGEQIGLFFVSRDYQYHSDDLTIFSISPSLYLAVESMSAVDLCGLVGSIQSRTILAFNPEDISTQALRVFAEGGASGVLPKPFDARDMVISYVYKHKRALSPLQLPSNLSQRQHE